MSLDKSLIKQLAARAHALKPIILVGQKGLTPEVLEEAERAIAHHELIKVRLNAADKAARQAMITTLCDTLKCDLVQSIGHVVAIYREKTE